jgi:hypothetical protein
MENEFEGNLIRKRLSVERKKENNRKENKRRQK